MLKRNWIIRFLNFSILLITLPFIWLTSTAQAVSSPQNAPTVLVLTADGPLTPSMFEYLQRGIKIAQQRGAELLVLQLNTPGGQIDLMNKMEQAILASPVPVVVYISPRGAMAASAGTIITLAGHASAMAPGTTIGAASPVGSQGEDLGETLSSKIKNDMKATVRTLAIRRRPEAIALAEQTIESASAASAEEALQVGLVDFIATDLTDLLQQLDGFKIMMGSEEITLHTAQAIITPLTPSFIEQLLGILTNPNIAYILLAIGVQAILIELSSPGGWVAGFIGVVCLGLATYGMGVLTVNWFGLLFVLTAFVLFLLDLKAPTHGALTIAGSVSLIVGALVLFNSPGVPQFQQVSVPLVVVTSLITTAIFVIALTFAWRVRKTPILTGRESIVGQIGVARTALAPHGNVQLGAELWSGEVEEGAEELPQGTQVEVIRVEGLRLVVGKQRIKTIR